MQAVPAHDRAAGLWAQVSAMRSAHRALCSALLAWHEREPFGRLAWLTVAVRQGYLAYAAAVGVVPIRAIAGTLLVAFAVLLTVSGARKTPR